MNVLMMLFAVATFTVQPNREADADNLTATCPADVPRARSNVVRLLTAPDFSDERTAWGLAQVSASTLRPLADPADATVCQQLAAAVTLGPGRYPRTVSYYTAGGYYFVSTSRVVPEGRQYLAFTQLLVLDQSLNFVASAGM